MANEKFKPYTMVTIPQVISAGKDLAISESTMAFKTVIDDELAICVNNVITKHITAIKPYIETVSMSVSDFSKYKNKPSLYCYHTYGTPELMSSLLYINNMISVTEFTKPTFKRFKTSIMKVINELMSLDEKELKKNRIDNQID